MADKLVIGKDYAPKDLVAKITGRAKYSEDFRAEGMAFAKLLLSPMPRCRVVSIDARAALAMDGVYGILTADDLETPNGGGAGRGGGAGPAGDDDDDSPETFPAVTERPLTNEPMYQGQPIAAIAAVDETTAAEAVERLRVEYEPLPFVLDPLDSLRPGGPNGHPGGNCFYGNRVGEFKWTAEQMAQLAEGRFPADAENLDGWEFGDIEAGFAEADHVVEDLIYHQCNTHHPMEPRTSMAYWSNGRCFLHCSTQSFAQTRNAHANRLGIERDDLVLISEYCGGGFGSKISGTITDIIPALLSRKIGGRPVMMRVTRDEETYYGRARSGLQGWVKIGFRADGRVTAIDLFLIMDSGPFGQQGDRNSAANIIAHDAQPESMRFRTISVVTNTPPRSAQRAPGGAQGVAMIEPLMGRAADELGIDRLDLMRINAPQGQAQLGIGFGGQRPRVTSAFTHEAIDIARELFNWDERKLRNGQVNGSKITGIGAALSSYTAGSRGFDGLLLIRPDGRLYVHQGIGNLGTHSVVDTARAAAEVLQVEYDDFDVVWGDSNRHVPWSSIQAGSQTTHAHTRANYVAAQDALQKLREIAARDLGGSPNDYEVGGRRVFRRGNPGVGMTFARAAERAIELGGRFDGHELPDGINAMTVASATALAGQGLMGVGRDTLGGSGSIYSYVVALAEIEVDRETGVITIVDMVAVAECGTVLNPRSLKAQTIAGVLQGVSMARFERWAFDPHWGVNANKRFYTAKPVTILDVPLRTTVGYVDIPDPQTPVGAKGIGEPPIGAGSAVILDALRGVLGRTIYHTPVTPDKVLSIIEGLDTGRRPLQTHV